MVLPLTCMLNVHISCMFHVYYLHVLFMTHVTCMFYVSYKPVLCVLCALYMYVSCMFMLCACLMHLYVLYAFFKNVVLLDVRLSSLQFNKYTKKVVKNSFRIIILHAGYFYFNKKK